MKDAAIIDPGPSAGDTFGAHLRALRKRAELSQSELARICGLGQGSISNLESGRREPTFESVCLIADALELPVDAFRIT